MRTALLAIVVVTSLVLAGCADRTDGGGPGIVEESNPTPAPEAQANGTTEPMPSNQSEPENSPDIPSLVVDQEMGIRINLAGGPIVHVLRLVAPADFSVRGISFHSDGGTPADDVHYGIGLWPADGGPQFDALCEAADVKIWDSGVENTNVNWDGNVAGVYDLWVWNAAGTWIGLEFNGGGADEDSPAYTPAATPWRVETATAEWSGSERAEFSKSLNLSGPSLFMARATPPNAVGLAPSASMKVEQDGATCGEDTADAAALQRPRDLRIAATVMGEAIWSGAYDVERHLNAGGSANAAWFYKTS